jgi:hypothetical protein
MLLDIKFRVVIAQISMMLDSGLIDHNEPLCSSLRETRDDAQAVYDLYQKWAECEDPEEKKRIKDELEVVLEENQSKLRYSLGIINSILKEQN